MAAPENNGSSRKAASDFGISSRPLEGFGASSPQPFDLSEFVELPPISAGPLLVAIARDPQTVFVYWNVDWRSLFGSSQPSDRQVHLRVYYGEKLESSAAVEPMSGNHYLKVSQPGATYRVEIGYYRPEKVWHSLANSEVTMPAQGVAEKAEIDLATIPFHLSFQRLIDLFRAQNGEALTEMISRLQRRAVSEQERALLTQEEWEILRAMDVSIDEFGQARRAFLDSARSDKLRQRAEAVLGFGSTSPAQPFGGSSWS